MQETYPLTLTPDKATIEPSGTAAGDAKSNTQLTVTIKDANTKLPPDKAVQIRLIVHKPTQGGHDHDDPTRPRGSLANQPCTSDEPCHTVTLGAGTGSTSVRFDAPIVSGTHTFTAQCDKCQGDATATLDVKVEGLEPIPDSQFYQLYERVGNTYKAVGETAEHHSNHFLTPAASEQLWRIASAYRFELRFMKAGALPLPLHVNDASLKDGGKFDIIGTWTGSHKEHTRGVSVDIRANNATGAIDAANFGNVDKLFNTVLGSAKSNGGVETYLQECTQDKKDQKNKPPTLKHKRVWPTCVSQLDGSQDDGRHYHLRLMGVAK